MNLDRDTTSGIPPNISTKLGASIRQQVKSSSIPSRITKIPSREYFLDTQGHMWYATPANNKVGYFYLAKQ